MPAGSPSKGHSQKSKTKSNFANLIGTSKSQGDSEAPVDSQGNKYADPKPFFEDHEDPVDYLGFGVSSYFHVIRTFIFLFFVLTLVNIPVLRIYTSYSNYRDETSEKISKITSLGNMGFS